MSVTRYLAAKAAAAEALQRVVPLPSTQGDFHDRQCALADLLADEIVAWVRWKNPSIEISPAFVLALATSFASDVFVPFVMGNFQTPAPIEKGLPS